MRSKGEGVFSCQILRAIKDRTWATANHQGSIDNRLQAGISYSCVEATEDNLALYHNIIYGDTEAVGVEGLRSFDKVCRCFISLSGVGLCNNLIKENEHWTTDDLILGLCTSQSLCSLWEKGCLTNSTPPICLQKQQWEVQRYSNYTLCIFTVFTREARVCA